jgi:hypothetical protein
VVDKQYLFAGFNALNASEEKIIQHLMADQAKKYWDADQTFLNDPITTRVFFKRFKELETLSNPLSGL